MHSYGRNYYTRASPEMDTDCPLLRFLYSFHHHQVVVKMEAYLETIMVKSYTTITIIIVQPINLFVPSITIKSENNGLVATTAATTPAARKSLEKTRSYDHDLPCRPLPPLYLMSWSVASLLLMHVCVCVSIII